MAGLQTSDLDIGLLGATQITVSCPLTTILIYVHRKELRASSTIFSGPLGFTAALLTYSRWTSEWHIKSK